MSKELVISTSPHETRVAILENGNLVEIYVEREKEYALVGSIYKGRVTRVLPGMQSAFVDIGLDTDAFLYVSDVLEEIEEYDQIVSTVEDKVAKMEEQGGQVFSAEAGAPVEEPPEVTGTDQPLEAQGNVAAPAAQQAAPQSGGYRQEGFRGGYRGQGPREGGLRRGDQGNRYGGRGSEQGAGGYGRGPRHARGGRRGRHQGRGHDDRRSLPNSKYVSPGGGYPPSGGPGGAQRGFGGSQRYEPPRDLSTPTEEYEPIILPGESLAKYKNRAPASSGLAGPLAAGAIPMSAEETVVSPAIPETQEGLQPAAAMPPAVQEESLPEAREEATAEAAPPAIHAQAPLTQVEFEEEAAEPRAEETEEEESEGPRAAGSGEIAAPPEEAAKEDLSEAEEAALLEAAMEDAQDATLEENSQAHTDASYQAAEPAGESAAEAESEEEETDREIREGIFEEAAGAAPERTEPETPEAMEERSARVEGDSRQRFNRPLPRGRDRRDRGPAPRGGRPHRGRSYERHQAQRRAQSISDLLKPGQEVIIQIAKEPLGKKGARITSHVALPGRFLVYMPTLQHTGVSRKINSAEARSRLRHLVTEYNTKFPGGFIVRTAAESASEEEVRADIEYLGRTWQEIKSRAEQRKAPALLHRDLNLVERVLRDYFSPDFTAIWVDSQEEYARVAEFIGRFQPELVSRVKLYTKEAPIFEEFGIQQEIDKALRPKVWLKSGGYIVINHTEALVAIDVNTGKFVGKGSNRLEDTIVKTNTEACKEIVRQIRLRDLGGIIVVDFIDMEERKNRAKVMQALEEALREDRAPSKVLGFNEFGLVNITRKRTKQALERTLCQPCIYCSGSGMIKSVHTICYEAQAEARKMAPELDGQSLTLRVHPEIAKALKTRESALIEELERWTKKSVIIHGDPSLHWEQYDIY
jgi:ribonuclease G